MNECDGDGEVAELTMKAELTNTNLNMGNRENMWCNGMSETVTVHVSETE